MDFFQTLAECSVAFAGFAAVHAVLKGGNSGRILHRSFTIVMTGSLAFVLSLLVLILNQFGFSELSLWRTASAVALLISGLGVALFLRSHSRLTALGDGPQSPAFFFIGAVLLLASQPLLIANLTGWFWIPSAPAYGAALSLMLFTGVIALLGSFWFSLRESIHEAESAHQSAERAAERD
jgi:hypothetical protein